MPAHRRNRLQPEDADRQEGRVRPARLNVVDTRELTTGAFVVGMALLGSKLSPQLFAEASAIVATQAVFELPMALLAVCAGKAVSQPTTGWRAAYVGAGLAIVAAAGVFTALDLGMPSAIAGGVWMIVARTKPPHGCSWFSVEHCRDLEVTAGTAWALLIGGLALLWLLSIASPHPPGRTAPGFIYAIAWGCYYLALAFLLPHVRRRARTRRAGRGPRRSHRKPQKRP